MRISPDYISELKENEIFVFGSNLAGRHGAGAAKTALQWGAEFGYGLGLRGQTYAIPTKGYSIWSLPLEQISVYIDDFIEFAKDFPNLNFLVTEIGCGLAGYKVEDIAPLFREAINVENIYLPKRFWEFYCASKEGE